MQAQPLKGVDGKAAAEFVEDVVGREVMIPTLRGTIVSKIMARMTQAACCS